MGEPRSISRPVYAAVLAIQWVVATAALAAVFVYASPATVNLVSPHLSADYLILGAFLAGALLGPLSPSVQWMLVLVTSMCLVASATLGAVIFMPGWLNIIPRSVPLQDFALFQSLFIFLWTIVPTLIGGWVTHLLTGGLRADLRGPDPDAVPLWGHIRRDDPTEDRPPH